MKKINLKVKDKVYEACVRSYRIYGVETWAISVENMGSWKEKRMLRLMCTVRIQGRIPNADLRNRFGIDCIKDVVRCSILRWFWSCGT